MSGAKTFIVTGGSKGIGAAVARYLLSQSHNVVLAARGVAPMEEMKKAHPSQVEYLAADMTSPKIPGQLVELAVEKFGGLDGIVINHGVLSTKLTADMTIEEFKHDYDVNVFSCLAMAKAGLEELRKKKGCVVFTSSGAAIAEYRSWAAYGSSKAALNSLCRHIAVEEPDITFLAVGPGRVNTDMQGVLRSGGNGVMDPAEYQSFVDAFKSGTLLKPEQPGHVMAKFVVNPEKTLSGKFISWKSDELAAYQE